MFLFNLDDASPIGVSALLLSGLSTVLWYRRSLLHKHRYCCTDRTVVMPTFPGLRGGKSSHWITPSAPFITSYYGLHSLALSLTNFSTPQATERGKQCLPCGKEGVSAVATVIDVVGSWAVYVGKFRGEDSEVWKRVRLRLNTHRPVTQVDRLSESTYRVHWDMLRATPMYV